jgi:phosphatidylglycerophosphate synthase
MNHDSGLNLKLLRWSEQNALLMTLAILGVLADGPPALPVAVAAATFPGLLLRCRGRWTPDGRFGPANAITLARFLGTLALLVLPFSRDWWPVLLALSVLGADGLDGWTARRNGLASDFGQQFDQEVDAFFFLALCLLLYDRERLGTWVLLPGALRYLFVLFVGLAKPPWRTVRGNRLTRAVSVAAIGAFIVCLLPVAVPCLWLGVPATLGLCGSFLYSVRQLYRPEPEA